MKDLKITLDTLIVQSFVTESKSQSFQTLKGGKTPTPPNDTVSIDDTVTENMLECGCIPTLNSFNVHCVQGH